MTISNSLDVLFWSLPFPLACERAKSLMRNHILGTVISAAVFCSSDFWEESLMCFTQTNVFIIYSKRSWNVFFNNWFLLNIWEHRDVRRMLQQQSNEVVQNMPSKKKKRERERDRNLVHTFFFIVGRLVRACDHCSIKKQEPPQWVTGNTLSVASTLKCRVEENEEGSQCPTL